MRAVRSDAARRVLGLAMGASLATASLSSGTDPTVALAAAGGSDGQGDGNADGHAASVEELDTAWGEVLAAMDAEAEARAKLMSAQGQEADIRQEINDIEARVAADDAAMSAARDSLESLSAFLKDPSTGSDAYLDALMQVADSISALGDAQDDLSAAKEAYSHARQAVADAKAAMEESDAAGDQVGAEERLAAAEAALAEATKTDESAQAALDEATKGLGVAADGGGQDAAKGFADASAAVDKATKGLAEATAQRTELEATVAHDEEMAAAGETKRSYTSEGKYLDGVDISGYERGIDFSQVDVDFAIVKATEGPTPDGEWFLSDYEERADSVIKNGKLLGFYHFYSSNADPVEQARWFVDSLDGYIGKGALFLDWESRTYSADKGGGSSDVVSLDPSVAKQWLDEVYRLTGVKPGIYMSRSVTTMHDWSEVAKDYPLWVAAYPSSEGVRGFEQEYHDAYGGNVGAWGTNPIIWQYSSTTYLDGWHAAMDVNVFYGDEANWNELVRQDWSVKLEADRKSLEQARSAEEKARQDLDAANAALAKASEGLGASSPEMQDARTTFESASSMREAAATALSEAQSEEAQARRMVEESLTQHDLMQEAVDRAEEGLAQADADMQSAQAKVDEAQRAREVARHRKEVVDSIVNGGGEAPTADAGNAAGGSGSAATAWIPMPRALTALASSIVSPYASGGSSLPGVDAILADPSTLDSHIAASDGAVAEVLSQMKADAEEHASRSADKAAAKEELASLDAKLKETTASQTSLSDAVTKARDAVAAKQDAYAAISPDGKVSEPEGYSERHPVTATALVPDEPGAPALVSVWLGVALTVTAAYEGVLVVHERRRRTRSGDGVRGE